MMKIILLEDRPGRQEQYIDSEKVAKLKALQGLKILLGEECRDMINKLNQADDSQLNEFTLILIHRSALSAEGIDTVTTHCQQNKKNLVFFSGGISQSLFTSQNFPYLLLNSKDFYQSNMLNFLSKFVNGDTEHITELVYGDSWKLNLMLNYRQLLLKGELGRLDEIFKESLEELIGKLPLEELNKEIKAKITLI